MKKEKSQTGEATNLWQPTRGKETFGLNEKAGYQVQNQCTWSLNPLKDKYKRDLIYLLLSLQATNCCIPCSWWMLRDASTLFCFKVSITAWCPYTWWRSTEVTKHDSAHTRKHADPCLPLPPLCSGQDRKSVTSERNAARCFLIWKIGWHPAIKQTAMDLKNLKCCVNVAVLRVNFFFFQTAQIH